MKKSEGMDIIAEFLQEKASLVDEMMDDVLFGRNDSDELSLNADGSTVILQYNHLHLPGDGRKLPMVALVGCPVNFSRMSECQFTLRLNDHRVNMETNPAPLNAKNMREHIKNLANYNAIINTYFR